MCRMLSNDDRSTHTTPTWMLLAVTPGARVSVAGATVVLVDALVDELLVDLQAASSNAATKVNKRYLRTRSSFVQEPRTRLISS